MAGSPFFMAPEIILGRRYDEKADIWSLGMVILQLLKKGPIRDTSFKVTIARLCATEYYN